VLEGDRSEHVRKAGQLDLWVLWGLAINIQPFYKPAIAACVQHGKRQHSSPVVFNLFKWEMGTEGKAAPLWVGPHKAAGTGLSCTPGSLIILQTAIF